MAKTKSKSKLSAFSRFSKQQLIIAGIFILGFGGFGVWKLAFSSAESYNTIKSVSGTWNLTRSNSRYIYDSLKITPVATYGEGTYRICAVVRSGGDIALASNTAKFFFDPSGFNTSASVGPKINVTKCSISLYLGRQYGATPFTPALTLDRSSENSLIVKEVFWQKAGDGYGGSSSKLPGGTEVNLTQ